MEDRPRGALGGEKVSTGTRPPGIGLGRPRSDCLRSGSPSIRLVLRIQWHIAVPIWWCIHSSWRAQRSHVPKAFYASGFMRAALCERRRRRFCVWVPMPRHAGVSPICSRASLLAMLQKGSKQTCRFVVFGKRSGSKAEGMDGRLRS